MNQNICTTPEQSKRLIACGVDPKSADFVWMEDKPNNPRLTLRTEIIEDSNPYIVAFGWSLGRILALLPFVIDYKYYLTIQKHKEDSDPFHWGIAYMSAEYDNKETLSTHSKDAKFPKLTNDLIEGLVMIIQDLKRNGYKLNEIKQ